VICNCTYCISFDLGQSKIYTTGTFNINRHEVDEEIKQGGGQVTSNIKEADLIVVGNNPSEREMVYLKGRSIPQIDLELLYKVLQAEIPLSSIMDTPGKVSFASSTIGIQRGDSSSSKSVLKYGFPPRIPKGRIDKVGDREGTSRSSLAAASALGHNSLLKPMSQGEGGTKASSRKRDQATDVTGPTENTNRGGMNAAEPSTQSAFTQKKDEAREKNIGDAQDNNKSRWGNSRRTRAGQITNYIHTGIIDKRSSLMGEGRGGPPRSSRIEAGNVVDCKSIMPTGQVECWVET
jgi:hypothetical protein